MAKLMAVAQKIEDERRSDRAHVRITAGIKTSGGRKAPVVVRNISCHGFLAECAAPIVPGSLVQLNCCDGESIDARVAWTRDGHFGAAFVMPISEELLASIL